MEQPRAPLLADLGADPNSPYAIFMSKDWGPVVRERGGDWCPELASFILSIQYSPLAMVLLVGPDLLMFYNAAYSHIIAEKHPFAMGRGVWEIIPESKPLMNDNYLSIMRGKPFTAKDRCVPLIREGSRVELYFTYTGMPFLGFNGQILAAYFVVQDTTVSVRTARRMQMMRELTDCSTSAIRGNSSTASTQPYVETVARSCLTVVEKNVHDAPFAAIYVRTADDGHAVLVGATGVEEGELCDALFPGKIRLTEIETLEDKWGIVDCFRGAKKQVLHGDLEKTHGQLTKKPWGVCPKMAHVLPIRVESAMPIAHDPDLSSFVQTLMQGLTNAVGAGLVYDRGRVQLRELQQLNEVKSSFVANISHEFRTPLTLILSPIEDLLRRPDLVSKDTAEVFTLMHRNAVRLLYMVNTLLEFTTSEAKALSATYEKTDLASFTMEIVSQFERAISHAQLTLHATGFDVKNVDIYIDRAMWEKIVVNLLANAIKYTGAGGEIYASLQMSSQTVQFVVQDTGVGIAPENLPHIFERFFRARQQAYTEGTGIGLALVKELVHAHSGSIRVRSEVGKGSTFAVELRRGTTHLNSVNIREPTDGQSMPTKAQTSQLVQHASLILSPLSTQAVDASAASSDVVGAEAANSSKEEKVVYAKILIVDDNEHMLQYVGNVLSHQPQCYALRMARNGRQALQIMHDDKPDLVLSDVMMPELDGMGLVAAVRSEARLADVPIVLMSARGAEHSRVSGHSEGADDYIVKPFSSAELLTRVKGIIELSRVRRQLASESAASRMKDRFVAVLSQELRNPLSAALLTADLLVAEANNPIMQEHANVIRGSIEQETMLIDELLECMQLANNTTTTRNQTQTQTQTQTPSPAPSSSLSANTSPMTSSSTSTGIVMVDVSALVHRAIESMQAELRAKRTEVESHIDARGMVAIAVNEDVRLLHAIRRLIGNAIANSQSGGKIVVRTAKHTGSALSSTTTTTTITASTSSIAAPASSLSSSSSSTSLLLLSPLPPASQRHQDHQQQQLSIEILDFGTGVSASILPKMFDQFIGSASEPKSIRRSLSSGVLALTELSTLGLYLAASIIRQMGGAISAASDGAAGHGTLITVTLPLAVEQSAHTVVPPPLPSVALVPASAAASSKSGTKRSRDEVQTAMVIPEDSKRLLLANGNNNNNMGNKKNSCAEEVMKGLRVLIVENNPTTLHIMRRLLHEVLRCDVTTAACVDEAKVVACTKRFDVLLSDIELPDGTGWELMTHLRKEQAQVVGIAVSGYSTAEDIERSQTAGFLKHLTKPVGLAAVRAALEDALDARVA